MARKPQADKKDKPSKTITVDPATIRVQQEAESPKPVIKPVTVVKAVVAKAEEVEIDVPDGYVYIVGVRNGVEIPNSGFFYPERNHKKIYGDESKYLVKKKGNLL